MVSCRAGGAAGQIGVALLNAAAMVPN